MALAAVRQCSERIRVRFKIGAIAFAAPKWELAQRIPYDAG